MSNYLRNVAHRATGASLLRPRVPSRFEPVAGTGLAMNHFREAVIEREAEAPRAMPAKATRPPVPPVPVPVADPQVRHDEARTKLPLATRHTAEEPAVIVTRPQTDQSRAVQEPRIQNDSAPISNVRPEITPKPEETRISVSQNVITENVQPRRAAAQPTVQNDTPPPVAARPQQQFPAPEPERRTERNTPAMKAAPQIQTREFRVVAAPTPPTERTVFQPEPAPSIHVSIGRVTVQATLPPAPAHAPARTAAHSGPRLTLERYLDRRGGRP